MCAAKVEAVAGPAGSGKTSALVGRVRELVASGVPAGEVLVVTPSPDAALELRLRLEGELAGAEAPRVVGVRTLLWELAGRPRVLAAAERTILLADLRAQGFSGAQVSAALEAACEAWYAAAWPQTGDACGAALLRALEERGAVLPEALLALAARGVAGVTEAASDRAGAPASASSVALTARGAAGATEATVAGTRPLADHILVDDAQALSPAALSLLAGLARVGFFLAGDPVTPCALFDAAADPQAFLGLAGPQGSRTLEATPHALGARRSQAVKWADAGEELAGVCALMDAAHTQAGSRGPLVVCANNPAWARSHARALVAAGMEVLGAHTLRPLACDARDARACQPLRAFAALGLLACADDVACWRSWCALGYADLASVAWTQLEEYARACGRGLAETLCGLPDAVADGSASFAGATQLAARVREAEALFAACAKHLGAALLDELDAPHTPAFRQLIGFVDDEVATLDAQGLYALGRARLAAPSLGMQAWDVAAAPEVAEAHPVPADARRRVFVCPVEALPGVHPRMLAVVGANAGLVREGRFAQALAVRADRLAVSYVQRMPQDIADKLGAAYRRTRRQDGQVMALLAACESLTCLGQDAPATMSGQQFCSAVLDVRP